MSSLQAKREGSTDLVWLPVYSSPSTQERGDAWKPTLLVRFKQQLYFKNKETLDVENLLIPQSSTSPSCRITIEFILIKISSQSTQLKKIPYEILLTLSLQHLQKYLKIYFFLKTIVTIHDIYVNTNENFLIFEYPRTILFPSFANTVQNRRVRSFEAKKRGSKQTVKTSKKA